jgi:DNA gyrase subunit A
MLITQAGQIVRIGVDDIRTIGRATQGVRVISLRKDDELVSVAKVINEDEDDPKLPLDGKTKTGKTPHVETGEDGAEPADEQPADAEPNEDAGDGDAAADEDEA